MSKYKSDGIALVNYVNYNNIDDNRKRRYSERSNVKYVSHRRKMSDAYKEKIIDHTRNRSNASIMEIDDDSISNLISYSSGKKLYQYYRNQMRMATNSNFPYIRSKLNESGSNYKQISELITYYSMINDNIEFYLVNLINNNSNTNQIIYNRPILNLLSRLFDIHEGIYENATIHNDELDNMNVIMSLICVYIGNDDFAKQLSLRINYTRINCILSDFEKKYLHKYIEYINRNRPNVSNSISKNLLNHSLSSAASKTMRETFSNITNKSMKKSMNQSMKKSKTKKKIKLSKDNNSNDDISNVNNSNDNISNDNSSKVDSSNMMDTFVKKDIMTESIEETKINCDTSLDMTFDESLSKSFGMSNYGIGIFEDNDINNVNREFYNKFYDDKNDDDKFTNGIVSKGILKNDKDNNDNKDNDKTIKKSDSKVRFNVMENSDTDSTTNSNSDNTYSNSSSNNSNSSSNDSSDNNDKSMSIYNTDKLLNMIENFVNKRDISNPHLPNKNSNSSNSDSSDSSDSSNTSDSDSASSSSSYDMGMDQTEYYIKDTNMYGVIGKTVDSPMNVYSTYESFRNNPLPGKLKLDDEDNMRILEDIDDEKRKLMMDLLKGDDTHNTNISLIESLRMSTTLKDLSSVSSSDIINHNIYSERSQSVSNDNRFVKGSITGKISKGLFMMLAGSAYRVFRQNIISDEKYYFNDFIKLLVMTFELVMRHRTLTNGKCKEFQNLVIITISQYNQLLSRVRHCIKHNCTPSKCPIIGSTRSMIQSDMIIREKNLQMDIHQNNLFNDKDYAKSNLDESFKNNSNISNVLSMLEEFDESDTTSSISDDELNKLDEIYAEIKKINNDLVRFPYLKYSKRYSQINLNIEYTNLYVKTNKIINGSNYIPGAMMKDTFWYEVFMPKLLKIVSDDKYDEILRESEDNFNDIFYEWFEADYKYLSKFATDIVDLVETGSDISIDHKLIIMRSWDMVRDFLIKNSKNMRMRNMITDDEGHISQFVPFIDHIFSESYVRDDNMKLFSHTFKILNKNIWIYLHTIPEIIKYADDIETEIKYVKKYIKIVLEMYPCPTLKLIISKYMNNEKYIKDNKDNTNLPPEYKYITPNPKATLHKKIDSIKDIKDLRLFLWKLHNAINLELGEKYWISDMTSSILKQDENYKKIIKYINKLNKINDKTNKIKILNLVEKLNYSYDASMILQTRYNMKLNLNYSGFIRNKNEVREYRNNIKNVNNKFNAIQKSINHANDKKRRASLSIY